MPNYCANLIEVKKANETAEAHAEYAALLGRFDDGFLLNDVCPMPEALKDTHHGSLRINGVEHKAWREIEVHDGVEKVPMTSEEIAELTARFGASNWYDWCVKHWGTKWDVEEDTFFWEDEGCLRSGFSTAWSPPRPVAQELSRQYPNLEITLYYIETGVGFAGLDRYVNGELTEELYEDDGLTDETRDMSWFHAEQMEGYENPFERDDESDEIEEE